jgi:septal ring factor EnvC (AmiA/AmiB activator)
MKRHLLNYALAALLLLAVSSPALAQKQPTAQSLKEQVAKLEKEINRNKELQKKNKNDQKVTQNGLKMVLAQIDSQRKLVASLQEQARLLNGEITSRGNDIKAMEREVARMKQEYADMIYAAYKNHKLNNSMAFIFDAADFNDATRRIDYMRRYNRMREDMVARIDSLSTNLGREIEGFEAQKSDLETTKATRDKEIKSLGADETKYRKDSDKLAAEEKKLANTIKQKEKEKKTAQDNLQKIIEEEARKAAAVKLSAEDQKKLLALSGQFDQNKGKFPYPISGGVVIDRYGTHKHPTQPNLTVNNKGINIAAERNASVRSIFEGTVTRVIFIPGLNNCVMVQHGEYFTVYSNLASVQVKSGDKLSAGQTIGHIPDTADSNDYFLHFEIWKNTTNLNPEQWFSK